MLELTNAQIGGWIASFVLPLFRVAALLMTMPVIGTQWCRTCRRCRRWTR